MIDLSELDSVTRAEEGAECEIIDPRTGKGTGFFLSIKGADSQLYLKTLKETMKKSTDKTTPNEIKEACVIACTTGWREEAEVDGEKRPVPVKLDGKELRFNEDNLRLVFKRMPTIRDQAVAFQENRVNFLPIASAN